MRPILKLFPLFAMCATIQASTIGELEQELLRAERTMIESELKTDQAILELSKIKGIGGWFKGKEKKALRQLIQETSNQTENAYNQLRSLEGQIQSAVFEAGYSYEQKGEFQKALEMYFKVEHKDDRVKFRIATCYKGLEDYQEAITWVLKMAHTDENYLHVVDLYKLAGNMKECISWLFRILEPYENNQAEQTALKLVEEYDYEGKSVDFPDFHRMLSDVYLTRAFMFYSSDFENAKASYSKAVALRANGSGEHSEVSRDLVRFYRDQMREARELLEEKRREAEEHYQYRLREAQEQVDRAEHRLRKELRRAEHSYQRALQRSNEEVRRARHRLDQVRKDPNSTEEQNRRAQRNYEEAKKRFARLQNSHDYFIGEEVRPYRRRVREARDHYHHIMNSRQSIIEDYIGAYKQSLMRAQRRYEQIEELHSSVY